jgi:5-methylcytosine-specific restriction endonuclease McrA
VTRNAADRARLLIFSSGSGLSAVPVTNPVYKSAAWRSGGGAVYALSNLQAACASCNASKRNRSVAARAKRAQVRRREW